MLFTSSELNFYLAVNDNLYKFDIPNGKTVSIKVPPKSNTDNNPGKVKLLAKINCVAVQNAIVALCTSDKQLLLYDVNLNEIIERWSLNRAPSQLCLASAANKIIVADKTGDVYVYEHGEPKPTIILGHLSIILDVKLSLDEKYVITADRDEKIRVSCFPNAYNINSYCMGHTEFVISLRVINEYCVVSASGDGSVRFWNFIEGKELLCIDINNYTSDKITLDAFKNEMNSHNIQVNALPVETMDLQSISENIYHLAVSLYNLNEIFLFAITQDNDKFRSERLESILLPGKILAVHFFNKMFYILFKNDFYCYQFDNVEKYYKKYENRYLSKFINEMEKCDMNSGGDLIPMLFKRSFDNVLEYQERKKMRTENT